MKSKRSAVADPSAAFECRERVRWSDVDGAGIIYFGAYSRFVDIAECEFYRSLGFTYDTFPKRGLSMPRVHAEYDFFAPALLDDVLVMKLRVAGVGVHSVRYTVDVFRETDDVLLAEVTMVTVCTGADRKSAPLPDDFASALRSTMATE